MKIARGRRTGAVLLCLMMTFVTPAALAVDRSAIAERVLAGAFDGLPHQQLDVLTDEQMAETRGKLWPFIAAVAGIDLALAGFFWGVYLPATSGSQSCVACETLDVDSH